MFHCLSVFTTVFTTNLVLWCSVQLVLLWKQLSLVLWRRFPLWLAWILLWFCWREDGSCNVVPGEATAGPDPPHRGFSLTCCCSTAVSHGSVEQGSQRNLLPERHVLWRLAGNLLPPPHLYNPIVHVTILFGSDISGQSWGGRYGGQDKGSAFGSLSNIELQLWGTKRKPECSKCWHVSNRRVGLHGYRYRRCDNMPWLLWKKYSTLSGVSMLLIFNLKSHQTPGFLQVTCSDPVLSLSALSSANSFSSDLDDSRCLQESWRLGTVRHGICTVHQPPLVHWILSDIKMLSSRLQTWKSTSEFRWVIQD